MMEAADLKEIPLFERLSSDEREELAQLMEPASFRVGEKIFEEGEPEETLYVVTSGTLEVHKKVFAERTQRLATIRAPTVVGEVGLLTEPRACATVVARTRVQAYGIERDRLLELLDADSLAAWKIVYELGRTLAERMARTDESIAEIIARLDRAETRDLNVFQDKLIREWSF
jgi:CRP/FNR family transcriptional regulator, cyclic AMP receptor protein